MFAQLAQYLHYPFVRHALLVGVLISLCASLLGVTLVLKRFSLIGDGLSHVAFGAMAIAGVLHFSHDMYFILPATIVCAVLMLRAGQNTAIMGDAAVALLSVASLAIGYLLVNLFSTSTNLTGDVCTTLFGSTSILTLSKFDVYLSTGLSLAVIAIFVLFYNKIFACTFDEDFARATATQVRAYTFFIAVVIAVIIVLAMRLVGALLISALIIFPALSAMRVFRSFLAVTICSAVLSVVCSLSGMLISILGGTPVGSTIVCCDWSAGAPAPKTTPQSPRRPMPRPMSENSTSISRRKTPQWHGRLRTIWIKIPMTIPECMSVSPDVSATSRTPRRTRIFLPAS